MEGRADLHTHTFHSDGTLSPYQLVELAFHAGLSTLSITDHDSADGLVDGMRAGEELGVRVLPGVELSVECSGQEIHLLGYLFNHTNNAVLEYLSSHRVLRLRRAERIVQRLHALDLPLQMETVLEKAGSGTVGRAHIASALVAEGLVPSYYEAFAKYIGGGGPAYEPSSHTAPEEAIELMRQAGGITSLAHPGKHVSDEVVKTLIGCGLDGIEVVHPSHSQQDVLRFRTIVKDYGLVATGGSDFHGGRKNELDLLGKFTIPKYDVDQMEKRKSRIPS